MADITEASKIPTSCSQMESTVLQAPLTKVWQLFRAFAFDKMAPSIVTATEHESGGEGVVGSIIKMTYKDESVWRVRVIEFSERHHTVAYELLTAEPALTTSSFQAEIRCTEVTTDNTTFVTWTTEFSNDADLAVIMDQKYKKQEFFKNVQSNLE